MTTRRLRHAWMLLLVFAAEADAGGLRAGAAKVDITRANAGPINDPLYAKALVVEADGDAFVLVTLDAVSLGEIGYIKNNYLSRVRDRLSAELGVKPGRVLVNTSHCHGIVCEDVVERTVQAVKEAFARRTPVKVGAGRGREDRIMENRRLRMKDGRIVDVRHAYSLPPDEEVAAVGPVDPEIGVLRLDREDGRPLALVYNFACHPIQGVPSGGITADLSGFASRAVEDALGEGAVALFVQGCGGDVNPATYKDVNNPRNAETLGNLLGLSTVRAARVITTKADDRLAVVREVVPLPRADWTRRIERMEEQQKALVGSLRGTTLDLKSYLPLAVKYGVSGEYPSYASHRYLSEKAAGRGDMGKLDADNRAAMKQYAANIRIMEELTRNQSNLALLRKHQADNAAAEFKPFEAEVLGVRVGDFVLVTFPGELTVQTGLDVKKASPHAATFVAGYTNGYLYYAPTAKDLANPGAAQEDCDCILAPEWEAVYKARAAAILKGL